MADPSFTRQSSSIEVHLFLRRRPAGPFYPRFRRNLHFGRCARMKHIYEMRKRSVSENRAARIVRRGTMSVVVIGGTRGIGRAISERFARDGHAVTMGYLGNDAAAKEAEASVGGRNQ